MINEKTWCFSPETYALLRKKQAAEIDAWLDEHVAQETGYVLDDSLTLADAAAQAKAVGDALALKAPLDSPTFTGTPTAPTPTAGDSSTKVATTAFVRGEIDTVDAALTQMILASFPTDSITNQPVASFTDGADDIPVKSLTVNITPVQDLHGYDNPWPAGGNVNLLNPETANYGNYTIGPDGEFVEDSKRFTSEKITVGASVSVSITGFVSGSVDGVSIFAFVGIAAYDSNDQFLGRDYANGVSSFTWTTPADTAYVRYFEHITAYNGTVTPAIVAQYKRVFSIGSAVTEYSPYSNICPISGWTGANVVVSPTLDAQDGTIYVVSWQSEAGTVYGGTLTDNGNGTWTLQVTHEMFDAASVTWIAQSGNTTTWLYSTTDFVTSGVDYAEKYAQWTGAINDTPLNNFRVSSTAGVYVNTGDNTDSANKPTGKFALKYKSSALPDPITLISDSVKTLLGNNNIFADTGNINTLTYRADVGLYIAKKLAEA